MTLLKTCTKCGQSKEVTAFYASKTLKCGRRSRCISCEADGAAEKSRLWYAANKDSAKETRKKYREENKERIDDANKRWVAANRDVVVATKKRHRDANRDAINARSRERERVNPEPRAAARNKWEQKNPEVRRAITRNRRARVAGVGGTISKQQIQSLLTSQSWRCVVCRCDLHESGHHVDHIVPIAAGGANSFDNVQALCPPCNRSKAAKDPIDFMQSRGFLL